MILSLFVSTFPVNLEKPKHTTKVQVDLAMLPSQVQENYTDASSGRKMLFTDVVPKNNFFTQKVEY